MLEKSWLTQNWVSALWVSYGFYWVRRTYHFSVRRTYHWYVGQTTFRYVGRTAFLVRRTYHAITSPRADGTLGAAPILHLPLGVSFF